MPPCISVSTLILRHHGGSLTLMATSHRLRGKKLPIHLIGLMRGGDVPMDAFYGEKLMKIAEIKLGDIEDPTEAIAEINEYLALVGVGMDENVNRN